MALHAGRQLRLHTGTAASENYLRGVVTFQSIFPGCYSGRWPRIHFEVYESLQAATSGTAKVATWQMALPDATRNDVYATDGYSASVANLAQTSLAGDNVFRDGAALELPEVGGSVEDGDSITLQVGVGG